MKLYDEQSRRNPPLKRKRESQESFEKRRQAYCQAIGIEEFTPEEWESYKTMNQED